MIDFISENLGTIVIGAALVAIVAGVVASIVKKKKNGKSAGCNCGCDGCQSASDCHKN